MLDDEVQDRLAQLLRNENPAFTFTTFINWARFGNLLAFDDDSDEVSLQQDEPLTVPSRSQFPEEPEPRVDRAHMAI
jgi:hypothetical protein